MTSFSCYDVTILVELLNVGMSRIIAQLCMVTLNSFKPSVIEKVAPSLARFVILTVANQHRAFHNLDYPHSQKEKNRKSKEKEKHDASFLNLGLEKNVKILKKKWIRLTLRFQKNLHREQSANKTHPSSRGQRNET